MHVSEWYVYNLAIILTYFALQKSRSGDVPRMMQCLPEATEMVIPVLPDISLKPDTKQPRLPSVASAVPQSTGTGRRGRSERVDSK